MLQERNEPRSLFSPVIDFLAVGGISLAFLCLVLIIDQFTEWKDMVPLAHLAFFFSFIGNFPHFAHSYQLFYRGFFEQVKNIEIPLLFRVRMAFSGIIVPFCILFYLIAALIIAPQSAGRMVSVMTFFVGWHYAKQGYGVLITLSIYKRSFLKNWEKHLLKLNAYFVWLFTWSAGQVYFRQGKYIELTHYSVELPASIVTSIGWTSLSLSILSLLVILKIFFIDRRPLSFNGLIGYICGSYLWLGYANLHPSFALFVPLFHCLQYNIFVYRLKMNEFQSESKKVGPSTLRFVITGILLGGVFMHGFPDFLDRIMKSNGFDETYFLASFLLFINVHHYFIDNSFWKKENPRVRKYLFMQPS